MEHLYMSVVCVSRKDCKMHEGRQVVGVAPLIVRVLAQPDLPVLNVSQPIYVTSED